MNNQLNESDNKGDTSLRNAVATIVSRISDSLPDLKEPVKMFMAGGMAINFYTGYRPTTDVDASFSRRLLLPKADSLVVSFENTEGKQKVVYFDTNYNTSFALIHPDYEHDAYKVLGNEFENKKLQLYILSPIDLALSKVARFQGNDKEDIAELAKNKLVSARLLNERASEALDYYVGNTDSLLFNLKEASNIINEAQRDKAKCVGNCNAR